MNKNTELRKVFTDAGWKLIRENGHMLWGCPCGKHLVTSSHSVSYPRSIKNTLAKFRQLNKQCSKVPSQR